MAVANDHPVVALTVNLQNFIDAQLVFPLFLFTLSV